MKGSSPQKGLYVIWLTNQSLPPEIAVFTTVPLRISIRETTSSPFGSRPETRHTSSDCLQTVAACFVAATSSRASTPTDWAANRSAWSCVTGSSARSVGIEQRVREPLPGSGDAATLRPAGELLGSSAPQAVGTSRATAIMQTNLLSASFTFRSFSFEVQSHPRVHSCIRLAAEGTANVFCGRRRPPHERRSS